MLIIPSPSASLSPTSIKTSYESNADTNAFTDAEKAILFNTSGTNTGDQDLAGKQDVLVSGSNIKTVGGTSLLGAGDIEIVSTTPLVHKSAAFTAVAGTRYTLDSTSNTIPITTPVGPTHGDEIHFIDVFGKLSTNAAIINYVDKMIMGKTENMDVGNDWMSWGLVFDSTTNSWRLI